MATAKRSTVIGTVVDTLTTEIGWTEDFPIQGGLHIYNNELKAHIDGQIVTVYPQAGGGTTEVVNISSAQILAMGTTPIELLPAAGANKYYDIEKVILEYTFNTTAYTGDLILGVGSPVFMYLEQGSLNSGANWVSVMNPMSSALDLTNEVAFAYTSQTNSSLQLERWSGSIADGDGTLRVIITYTLRTFGA
jgi:hypothetical protein